MNRMASAVSSTTSSTASPFRRLLTLAEGRKPLLLVGILLSALGHVLALVPFLLIWRILQMILVDASTHRAEIIELAWWSIVAGVLYLLLYFAALMLCHVVAFRVERNIRFRSMQRVVRMPLGFFDRKDTGRLKNSVDDNAGLIHTFIAHQMCDIAGVLTCLLSLVVLFFAVDWAMGLISFVPMLISFIAMGMMMSNKEYKRAMGAYMDHLQKMNSEAVEYVRGIPVVKAFQQSIYSFNTFYRAIKDYEVWVRRYADSCKVPMSIYTISSYSYAFLLIPCAIIQLRLGADMMSTVSTLIFYILVTPFIGECTLKLMFLVSGKRESEAALQRIDALFEDEYLLSGHVEALNPVDYSIRLEGVSFRYTSDTPLVLEEVSLQIQEGERVALVGASGSGKTTIARLIARFWDPEEGEISIGGVSLRTVVPEEILKHISFVFQNEKLFKMSLRDNITYGSPDATEEQIWRAIRSAQCEELLAKLPEGLDTLIGSEGIYLSGGEQQRIVLARAFLKDAPILLLDEATAFADPENEREIQEALRELMQGKTVLMIAHRLTSVVDVDKILVMEKGRIVESGKHETLLRAGGLYTSMWNEYQKSIEWTL